MRFLLTYTFLLASICGLNAQEVVNFSESILQIQPEEIYRDSSFYVDKTEDEYVLYIHSSHKCGYCRRLRRSLEEVNCPKNLSIVFLEYDTSIKKILEAQDSYRGAEVRIVENFNRRSIKMFPYSQLINTTKKKQVKKIYGYKTNYWKRVFANI